MDTFNAYVVRNIQSKFPHFVSFSDDACVEYIQKYGPQGFEIGEATVVTVVSNEILLGFKDQLLHSNNLLEASKDVMDNQVKDLADAGRALARLQRERDQAYADYQREIQRVLSENAAIQTKLDSITAELRLANANLYNLRNAP